MVLNRKIVLREGRDLLFFLAIGIVQGYLMCRKCSSAGDYTQIVSFTFLMWLLLWKGNGLLAGFLSSKISWTRFPVKRLAIGVISTIFYTVIALVSLMSFFEFFLGVNFGKGYVYTIYGSIIITILISMFLHGREFLLHWQREIIEREKYEKESIAAKYESLKNQVNPHFLFNSLNALTNLVYEDQDKAAKFIKQLSEVYRYVLDTRDKEVVTIEEELRFLSSYIYLQQIRFGDKLKFNISLKNTKSYIAPLALQMLIENAIKHNVISTDEPLNIKVYNEDGFIAVENNFQKKSIMAEPSAGVGLENICKRYQLLTDSKVEIIRQNDTFKVRLPVLNDDLK
jgi:sensor histidine kinase YesM